MHVCVRVIACRGSGRDAAGVSGVLSGQAARLSFITAASVTRSDRHQQPGADYGSCCRRRQGYQHSRLWRCRQHGRRRDGASHGHDVELGVHQVDWVAVLDYQPVREQCLQQSDGCAGAVRR